MSLASLSKVSAKAVLTGPKASAILDEFARDLGLTLPALDERPAVPPWTEEEAAAFERTIDECFERTEVSSEPL